VLAAADGVGVGAGVAVGTGVGGTVGDEEPLPQWTSAATADAPRTANRAFRRLMCAPLMAMKTFSTVAQPPRPGSGRPRF
jgi:hypothetical protein